MILSATGTRCVFSIKEEINYASSFSRSEVQNDLRGVGLAL